MPLKRVGERTSRGDEGIGDGAGLLGGGLGPGNLLIELGDDRGWFVGVGVDLVLRRRLRALGVLELGAQPADEAALLLGRALGVERDQPREQFLLGLGLLGRLLGPGRGGARAADELVGEVVPAVGGKDGAVEFVV